MGHQTFWIKWLFLTQPRHVTAHIKTVRRNRPQVGSARPKAGTETPQLMTKLGEPRRCSVWAATTRAQLGMQAHHPCRATIPTWGFSSTSINWSELTRGHQDGHELEHLLCGGSGGANSRLLVPAGMWAGKQSQAVQVQVGRRKELKTRLIDLQSQQPSHREIRCRPRAVLLYKIVSPFHFNEMTYQNLFLMSHCKSLRNANVKGLGANSLVISAQLQKSVSHQLK